MVANSLFGIFFQKSGFISDNGTGVDRRRGAGVLGELQAPEEGLKEGTPVMGAAAGGSGGGGGGAGSGGGGG